jgi:glycosyltransferase involved in cell wall biosynthesis
MTNENHLISVIVAVYNTDKYLRECLDSIVNQTYKNLEIILVDDCSTDNCPQICDEYAARDNRVKVVHKEKNGGDCSARNAGLNAATGEFITFVDGDDYLALDKYEAQLKGLLDNDADMCSSGFYQSYKSGIEKHHPELVKNELITDRVTLIERLGYDNIWSAVYKKELFDGFHFLEIRSHGDAAGQYTALCKTKRYILLDGFHYYHRNRKSSISYSREKVDKEKEARMWHAYHDNLEQVFGMAFPDDPPLAHAIMCKNYLYFISLALRDNRLPETSYAVDYIKKHAKEVLNHPYLSKKDKMKIRVLRFSKKLHDLPLIILNKRRRRLKFRPGAHILFD